MSGISSNIDSKTTVNSVETFVDESQNSVLLLSSNSSRKKWILINESNKDMYIKFSATGANTNEGIKIKKDEMWIEETYMGDVCGVWENKADEGARIFSIEE